MKNWLALSVSLLAVVGLTQAQQQVGKKEIRSRTPLFWQDSTPWGQPVTGIRLSVQTLLAENGQLRGLRIAFQNISGHPQALSLGFLSTNGPQIPATLILTTPSRRNKFSAVSEVPDDGGIDPLVIPLVPNAVYAVHLPLTVYRPAPGNPSLSSVLAKATELSISFSGDKTVCDANGYPHPNPVPCWWGELESNVISLRPR